MKKLLGVVVLGLLLSGNAHANAKLEKALEKCADQRYISLTKITNFPRSIYSDSSDYQKIKKIFEETKIKRKNASDESTSKIMKWWDENPMPKRSDYKQVTTSIGTLDWPGFHEDTDKYVKDQKQYIKDVTKIRRQLETKLKGLEARMDTIIRVYALDYISNRNLSLKTKAKTVKNYLEYYKNCEIKYQSTPSSFMLEWGD